MEMHDAASRRTPSRVGAARRSAGGGTVQGVGVGGGEGVTRGSVGVASGGVGVATTRGVFVGTGVMVGTGVKRTVGVAAGGVAVAAGVTVPAGVAVTPGVTVPAGVPVGPGVFVRTPMGGGVGPPAVTVGPGGKTGVVVTAGFPVPIGVGVGPEPIGPGAGSVTVFRSLQRAERTATANAKHTPGIQSVGAGPAGLPSMLTVKRTPCRRTNGSNARTIAR